MYTDFFLDLDGTLKTDPDYDFKHGDTVLSVDGNFGKYKFVARPFAKDLCEYLSSVGKLYLTTLSYKPYCNNALDVLGVSEYFSDVVDARKMKNYSFPPSDNVLWIDNCPDGFKSKYKFHQHSKNIEIRGLASAIYSVIPAHSERDFYQVETFMGNLDDTVLLDVIDYVKKTGVNR